jgi:hypothetical protein
MTMRKHRRAIRVRGEALCCRDEWTFGSESCQRSDPTDLIALREQFLAPHPKPSLRFGFDLSPRKSGERL